MLPVLDTRVIETFKLPYLKQTIKIKPYKSSQEKALLHCLTDKHLNKEKWLENLTQIIKDNLVDTDLDLSKLKIIDFLYIAMKLRSVSKDDSFEMKYKCTGTILDGDNVEVTCPHVFKEIFPLEQLLKIKNPQNERFEIKVNDSLSLTIEPPNIDYLKYLSTLKTDEKIDENSNENVKDMLDIFVYKIAYSTSELIITENKKSTIYNDFNQQELVENILLNLTLEELETIIKKMKELISMSFVIKKQCPICKKMYKEESSDFFTLLV